VAVAPSSAQLVERRAEEAERWIAQWRSVTENATPAGRAAVAQVRVPRLIQLESPPSIERRCGAFGP
jgi:hypothetical protein